MSAKQYSKYKVDCCQCPQYILITCKKPGKIKLYYDFFKTGNWC